MDYIFVVLSILSTILDVPTQCFKERIDELPPHFRLLVLRGTV
jgi:hypothetical protein